MQRALRGYAEAIGYPVVWTASLGAPVPLLYVVSSLVTPDGRCADRLSVPPNHHIGQACGASEPITSATIRSVPLP